MDRAAPLPATPESVRLARNHVDAAARRAGASSETAEQARLLTSELSTNVVLHARTPFAVTVDTRGDRLRVEVTDASPARPSMRPYGPESGTGRGLRLLATMASAYGVADATGHPETELGQPACKTVWFELVLTLPAMDGSAPSAADSALAAMFAGIDVLAIDADFAGDDGQDAR